MDSETRFIESAASSNTSLRFIELGDFLFMKEYEELNLLMKVFSHGFLIEHFDLPFAFKVACLNSNPANEFEKVKIFAETTGSGSCNLNLNLKNLEEPVSIEVVPNFKPLIFKKASLTFEINDSVNSIYLNCCINKVVQKQHELLELECYVPESFAAEIHDGHKQVWIAGYRNANFFYLFDGNKQVVLNVHHFH